MRTVLAHANGERLTTRNTLWSKRHVEQHCWWLNIPAAKFQDILHLCLETSDGFLWLRLPANTFGPNVFRPKSRSDHRRNTEISFDEHDYMRDKRSGQDFGPYVQREFPEHNALEPTPL